MAPRILKLILLSLLALLTAEPATPATHQPAAPAASSMQLARGLPEVRLRKLHLVRPDLIPYPVMFEVYC